MRNEDHHEYIRRYENRLTQYGYSPQTLGWGKIGRQEVRFAVLGERALEMPKSSVLDVGCGFSDLYDFLRERGWSGSYTGIDIVPALLKVARQRHPGLDIRELDITGGTESLGIYDFVIASGVFNAVLTAEDNRTHISNALAAMHARARVAVCADFLSTYVDFQKPGGWHTDPAWAFWIAKQLSRRVSLRHDYMPFEFALFIFRDDSVSERNMFRQWAKLGAIKTEC
jgi:SAM-dependent methyltransferase